MNPTYQQLLDKKKKGIPISMVTAYDFPAARIVCEAGVDVLLVGDSVGTNVLGYESEREVTMDDMVHHLKAVVRGAPDGYVMADIPYGGASDEDRAFRNARTLVDAGAHIIKIEGWEDKKVIVESLAGRGIAVCGHIGYNPQYHGPKGRVFGREPEVARQLLRSARVLEQAGARMIIIEKVPEEIAKIVTENASIPVIGIGSGRYCDGQVLVLHDIIGLAPRTFRHARQYAEVYSVITGAVQQFRKDVEEHRFPAVEHSSHVDPQVADTVYREQNDGGSQ
ncbi:MAG: 3-methyl-2-oxobutanoate hydroxymethyltransferase [Chitinispirillaceae bacterium]|nr:3-methyl-2-oxobutanoate hydroxymethyltransferase [Chitinispirillaceae bacterium]